MTLDTSLIVCITMTLFVNVGKYDEPIIKKQRNRSKQFNQNSYSLHRSINVLINESRHHCNSIINSLRCDVAEDKNHKSKIQNNVYFCECHYEGSLRTVLQQIIKSSQTYKYYDMLYSGH